MYVPEHFELTNPIHQHGVIRAHPFALLSSQGEGGPIATHLPMELDAETGPKGTLRGHVARANPHWRAFEGGGVALAIFSGPHAYVSPNWYPAGRRVPTWNYVAVHVYGTPRIVDDAAAVESLLETMVERYEGAQGWSTAEQEPGYLEALRRGVVAFEMPIDRIEAKAKLGQNHSPDHRRGTVAGLMASGEPEALAVAEWMRRQLAGELG